ncbi:MAG TPA: hypothetical protein VFJ65_06350 [Solirubrobacterales bacterium]|nr:hypothetical protein [Solirubrobacterales bacterium]
MSRAFVSFGLVIACAIAIVLLVKGLYPADLPQSRNPDFVDNVFDNKGVLWAARLLLVSAAAVLAFGGVFIVGSIGIRMKNKEWLRRAGPFEISEGALSQAKDEAGYWRRATLASEAKAVDLRDRIKRSEELIEDLKSP